MHRKFSFTKSEALFQLHKIVDINVLKLAGNRGVASIAQDQAG